MYSINFWHFWGICRIWPNICWGSIVPQQWAHINSFLDQPLHVHRLYRHMPESQVNYICCNSFNFKLFFFDFYWIFFVLFTFYSSIFQDILFNLFWFQAKTFMDPGMQINANPLRLVNRGIVESLGKVWAWAHHPGSSTSASLLQPWSRP